MNIRRPNTNCPMKCTFSNGAECVCNLIAVTGETSPISLGLRIGLGHFYGIRMLPPFVRGTLGSSYWSTGIDSENSPQPVVPKNQKGTQGFNVPVNKGSSKP